MLQLISIETQLEAAESLGTADSWEVLARRLLAERSPPKAKRAKPAAKPRGENEAWLTLTERRARCLPARKERKGAGGEYVWVLVEFTDGVQMLMGQYPRKVGKSAGETERDEAIIGARARYLLLKGDGQYVDFRTRIPRVKAWRDVAAHELEALRARCSRIMDALVAFTFAPAWENDEPRPITWVKLRRRLSPEFEKINRAHEAKPLWWRLEYRRTEFLHAA